MTLKRERKYIGSVADKLTKKDLLVGVEGVDDQAEKLVYLGLECERLGLRRHCCFFLRRSEKKTSFNLKAAEARVIEEKERDAKGNVCVCVVI